MVSCDHAIRACGIPAIMLWNKLLPRQQKVYVHEDNTSMIQALRAGRNPTMRHLGRTHRVSIGFLYEQLNTGDFELCYEVSSRMAAEIYTKAFTDAQKWAVVREVFNIIDPCISSDSKAFSDLIGSAPSQAGGPSSSSYSAS